MTVAVVLVLTVGAVKRPVLDTVPKVAVQITETLLVPLIADVNRVLLPDASVVVEGEILMLTSGAEEPDCISMLDTLTPALAAESIALTWN